MARHLDDPVVRLKYLKVVGPVLWAEERQRWRVWWIWLLTLAFAVALIVFISLSRLRASVHVQNPPVRAALAVAMPTGSVRTSSGVWLVEKRGESETYSNGLRIDNRFLVATHRRSYLAFPADGSQPVHRSNPAGIVFHTTESQQAPFAASENGALKRIGESLLEYVRSQQAYNFVIDRFGRVYRIVAEEEVANHSGYSAWADAQWSYLNLNASFLAISFEAVSPSAQLEAEVSPAQVHSASMLIEMLRQRFRIAASNCVTHAQVSVNPDNMRLGLHVDWASGFPFEAMGLPDNYTTALPSLWAYGFDYDAEFASRAGERMQIGIEAAEAILSQRAADAGLRPAEYKRRSRRRYREMLAKVGHARVDGLEPE